MWLLRTCSGCEISEKEEPLDISKSFLDAEELIHKSINDVKTEESISFVTLLP